jgi:hypothetical protein
MMADPLHSETEPADNTALCVLTTLFSGAADDISRHVDDSSAYDYTLDRSVMAMFSISFFKITFS